jgi:prolyl-tRNA editing enzyme YbaK/EbsC (Cys-tRNA(Pro) deacylase)
VGAKDISLRRVEEILQAAGVRHAKLDMRGARFQQAPELVPA